MNPDDGKPLVFNLEQHTEQNLDYLMVHWTGKHIQLTMMSVPVNDEIGLEIHPDTDQFTRIESGKALVVMRPDGSDQVETWEAEDGFGILVPAGTWHNIVNIGDVPLKVYSVYGPPEHPAGEVEPVKKPE